MRYERRPKAIEAFRYGYETWPRWFQEEIEAKRAKTYSPDDEYGISGVYLYTPDVLFCPEGDYVLRDEYGNVTCEQEATFLREHRLVEGDAPRQTSTLVEVGVPSLLSMIYGERIALDVYSFDDDGGYLFSFVEAPESVRSWRSALNAEVCDANSLQEYRSLLASAIRRRLEEAARIEM